MPLLQTRKPRVAVLDIGDTRLVQYRWLNPTFQWLLIVPAILIGLPILIAVKSDARLPVGNQWFVAALVFAIFAVSAYCYLAKLFNSTSIAIDATTFSVRHGPIPWSSGFTIERATIDGVAVRERRESQNDGGSVSATMTSEIVVFVDGTEVPILSRLYEPAIADKIVSLVRQHLEVNDTGE